MRFSFQNQNEIQLSNCEKSPTFSFDFGKKNNFNFKYTGSCGLSFQKSKSNVVKKPIVLIDHEAPRPDGS